MEQALTFGVSAGEQAELQAIVTRSRSNRNPVAYLN